MVVKTEIKDYETLLKLKGNYCNHILLNTEHLIYSSDKEAFMIAIEVLNVINSVKFINDFYDKVGSKIKISTNILYKAIDAGFDNKPFTDEEIKEYFKEIKLIDNFFENIEKFTEFNAHNVPYELEFVLLGLSYENQDKLTEKQKIELFEEYGNINCNMRWGKIEINNFIDKAKILVNNIS